MIRPREIITADDLPLIDTLHRRHRDILLAQGTYGDIARTMKIPVGTVRSRLHRARAALAAAKAGGGPHVPE